MKKSTKITTVIVLSLGIVGASAVYAAKGHKGDHKKHAERAVSFITKKLDLDVTQEQSLSALKDQMLIAKDAMHDEMQTTRQDALSLVVSDSFDQGKALELITAKTATIDSVAPELVSALGNFMDSLNTEQKQEMLEMLEIINARKDGRRGRFWRL